MTTDPHERAKQAVTDLRLALAEMTMPTDTGTVPLLAGYTQVLASIEDVVEYHRLADSGTRSPRILAGFLQHMMLIEEMRVALGRDQTHSVD